MSLFDSASLVVTPNGTKASKLYAIKPTDGSGDLSVTRATTATRVNSSGLIESVDTNVPRLDYTNGTCPSILVEPQRTNITLQSENLGTTWYTAGGALTLNATTAPDGNTTADKIKADTSTDVHVYQQTLTVSNATVYTMSVYVKAAEYTYFELADTSSLKGQTFNLTAKTISAPQTAGVGAATSSKITDVGNGWLRCSITYTTSSTTGLFRISLSNGTSTTFTGDNTSGLFAWGAQLEAGSYPTSYIPTVASSVTRNADVISKTGISSLIGQTEGTIFIDANLSTRSNTRFLLDIQNGSNTDAFQFALSGNNLSVNIYDNGTLQAALNGGSLIGRKKIALGYKANDFVLYVNGVQLATDISGTVPTASLIALGYLYIAGGYELGDSINSSALWTTRLTNAELATLTTI